MSVTLEPVQQQELPIEPETAAEPAAEPEPAAEQEPAAEVEQEPAAEVEQEPVQPPKKRGRPKAAAPNAAKPKAAAPKAAAPKKAVRMKPPTPISSSDDDDEPLTRDDMETLLLDYLVKRKTSQQNARRNMWAQLAGLSLPRSFFPF